MYLLVIKTLQLSVIALVAFLLHRKPCERAHHACQTRSPEDSTIGITVASIVFQDVFESQIWRKFGHEKYANDEIMIVRNDLSAIKEFPSALMEAAKNVYMDILRAVFLTLLGLALPGVAVSLVR